MSIVDEIKSFEFDRNKNRIFGIKSGIIWGYSNKSNAIFPLLYLSKPKSISEEDFRDLLDRIEISIKK